MKFNSPKKYSGAAALLFLLIFPGLFAVFVWGVEGARILQSDARLKDATESAALAVSTQTDVTETLCNDLTEAFLNGYFPTATVEASESPCVNNEKPNEFQINASISEKTWFPNSNIASYGTSFTVSDSMRVTKKIEPVDVVLVANYSSTMNDKASDLEDTILSISKKVTEDEGSRVSVIGYDHFVTSYDKGRVRLDHNLVCNEIKKNIWILVPISYTEVSKDCIYFGGFFESIASFIDDLIGINLNPSGFNNLLGMIHEPSLFSKSGVNAESTIENVFLPQKKTFDLIDVFLQANKNAYDRVKTPYHEHSTYNVLDLTSNYSDIKNSFDNKDFLIKGDSSIKGASYTGLITGARIANSGNNSRKLILMLTDGKEQSSSVADLLFSKGLCQHIKNHFSSRGEQLEMAIIGFDSGAGYDDSTEEGAALKSCINRVVKYTDENQIEDILNLSSKNVGRLIN